MAKQQEANLKRMLRRFEESLDRQLEEAIEARKSPIEKSIEIAEAEFDLLRDAGGETTVEDLQKELVPIRKADQTGEYPFKASDQPELHFVSVQQGSTLPKEYAKGDRLSHGFAEIQVTYSARPVILALSSRSPMG